MAQVLREKVFVNRKHTNLDTSFTRSEVSLATELSLAAFLDDVTQNTKVNGKLRDTQSTFTFFLEAGAAFETLSGCVGTSAAASFDLDFVVLFFAAKSEVVTAGEEAGLRIELYKINYR